MGETFTQRELTSEEASVAEEYRNNILDRLSFYDDRILELYLEGDPVSAGEIYRSLRELTVKNQVVPVLCGSSFKNKGIQMLLDAVVKYLPSPLDIEAVTGSDPVTGEEKVYQASKDEPLSALAFKVATDPMGS